MAHFKYSYLYFTTETHIKRKDDDKIHVLILKTKKKKYIRVKTDIGEAINYNHCVQVQLT